MGNLLSTVKKVCFHKSKRVVALHVANKKGEKSASTIYNRFNPGLKNTLERAFNSKKSLQCHLQQEFKFAGYRTAKLILRESGWPWDTSMANSDKMHIRMDISSSGSDGITSYTELAADLHNSCKMQN